MAYQDAMPGASPQLSSAVKPKRKKDSNLVSNNSIYQNMCKEIYIKKAGHAYSQNTRVWCSRSYVKTTLQQIMQHKTTEHSVDLSQFKDNRIPNK
jgi:hypothetical protein